MAKSSKNWHLSSEARYILVHLRDAIQLTLEKDEKGSSCDFSGYYSLSPWIYKAFMKIWHRKLYCVRKMNYSVAHSLDYPKVLVSSELFEKFRSAYYREISRGNQI